MTALCAIIVGLFASTALAHPGADGHAHTNTDATQTVQAKAPAADTVKTTGQGDFVFEWDEGLTAAFPDAAKPFEAGMHGGFTEDPTTGIVYTGIPGYGLCSISKDLKTWTLISGEDKLKQNIHGICFFVHNGQKRLAVAQNGGRVMVLGLDGGIVSELGKPKGTEFSFEPANKFFSGKSNFAPTDVTYHDGTLYVAHGYSKGDFVMTVVDIDHSWVWGSTAWGGKGNAEGQFNTAHGIFAHKGNILVANREGHKVDMFTPEGEFLVTFPDIPKGSRVCNVAYEGGHYFLCPLVKIGNQASAPIYAHSGRTLKSTIIPGELGIPVLGNIHHVWPHRIGEDLYLLIHGWSKGKYAVLKLQRPEPVKQ